VNPTDRESRADGGQAVDEGVDPEVFTRTSEVEEETTGDKTIKFLDESIYAPTMVLVSDIRGAIGLVILVLFVLVGTVGVVIVPVPVIMQGPTNLPPFQSWEFPLGTSSFGKGQFRSLVHATPAMLKMIAAGALFSTVLGTMIGTVAGYKGGLIDKVLMSFTDVVLVIPGLALIIVLAAIYQPESPITVGLILGIDNWPGLSRTLRSQVLSIREEHFTEASRALGMSDWYIFRKDIITNMMPYISINFANASRGIIFESVALYYLGILPFTSLNWGVMLNEAFQDIDLLTDTEKMYLLAEPLITIIIISMGFVLLAQGLDRVFNVRLRARHARTVSNEEESTEEESDSAITDQGQL